MVEEIDLTILAARAILRLHPLEPRILRALGALLRKAGEADEALALYRRAESDMPYPERRGLRMDLLAWLRTDDAHHPDLPTWASERTARLERAEKHPGDLDARLAAGDVLQLGQRAAEAAATYLRVLHEAEEPGLQWAAWVGLAEVDPVAAWREPQPLFPREDFAELTAFAALAAGEPADGARRVEHERGGLVWSAALRALASDLDRARAGAQACGDAGLVDLLLGLLAGRLPLVAGEAEPVLRAQAEAGLAVLRAEPAVWLLACELAIELLPQATVEQSAAWWRRLVLSAWRDDQAALLADLALACATKLEAVGQANAPAFRDAAACVVRRCSRPINRVAVSALAEACRVHAPSGRWAEWPAPRAQPCAEPLAPPAAAATAARG